MPENYFYERTIYFFFLFLLISCNHTEVKGSHEELLNYEKNGYRILLKKKPIKIANMFLDINQTKKIEVDEDKKLVNIIRKDTILHLMNLSSVASNLNPENEIIIIDGFTVESKDFEASNLEMNAVQSVSVEKNRKINGRKYSKVYIFKTFSNDR